MSGLLRKLAIYLCSPIYKLIKYVYYIFYNLANTRFLNSEIISQFSSNIYILVSVVMLFAFSVVILSAIVNPDLLSDNKKGVTALFKRSILALFLMVLVPFMFNILYKLQSNIMDNSLIEKIIVGTNISCQQDESESADDSTTDDTSDTVDESESKCKSGGNGGQVIAGTLISALVYPIEDNINVDEDVQESYEAMIAEDIKHIGNFAEHINATTDGEDAGWLAGSDTNYAFVFNGLLAIVCGLGCVYILVIFSLDVAVRVFKLAFMELTAPISIVGYIAAGNKILSSWFQELVKTYVDLFIRIACIAFYLFLISNLSSFLEPFQNEDWGFVLKAFLVVGMLIFVKQVPDMISKIFGVDIKPKGGIGGRLGEMAAVGKQAQKAWNGIANMAKVGATGLAMAPVGAAVAGIKAGGRAIGNSDKVQNLRQALSSTKGGRVAGNALGVAGRSLSRVVSSMKAAYSSDGKALSSAYKAWKDNPAGQTYAARRDQERKFANERALQRALGINPNTGQIGNVTFAQISDSVATLDSTAKAHFATDSPEGQVMKSKITADRNKQIMESFSSGKDKIVTQLESALSNIELSDTAGRQGLQDLISKINSGKITTAALDKEIMYGQTASYLSGGQLSTISSTLDDMYNSFNNTNATKELGMSSFDNIFSQLKDKTAEFNKKYDDAKANYDAVYEKASSSQKETMNNLDRNSTVVNEKYVKVSKKTTPSGGPRAAVQGPPRP